MGDRLYAAQNGWRWAGWFFRRGKIVAGVRELFDAYVRGHNGETCQECGRPYLLWYAADDLYGRVTGRWGEPWSDGSGRVQAAPGLFCLACFDRMAEAKGISIIWQPEVYPGTARGRHHGGSRMTKAGAAAEREKVEAASERFWRDGNCIDCGRNQMMSHKDWCQIAAYLAARLTPDRTPELGGEYGRLLAERDRLIGEGVEPADLEMPDPPDRTPTEEER